jgi:hypothetical protein
MRVAPISDIHGNPTSLKVILANTGREQVAIIGPQPRKAVARLRSLEVRCEC